MLRLVARLLNNPQIEKLRQRREGGTMIKTLMKDYCISKATVYRYLN